MINACEPTICRCCGRPIAPATWRHLRENPNICATCEAIEAIEPNPAQPEPVDESAWRRLDHQDQIRLLFNAGRRQNLARENQAETDAGTGFMEEFARLYFFRP